MHNSFKTLQHQCRTYRLKRLITILLPLVLLLGAGIAALYYYISVSHNNKPITTNTMPTIEKLQVPIPAAKAETPLTEHNTTRHTNVSIEKEHNSSIPSYTKDVSYELHVDADYIPKHPAPAPKKVNTTPSHASTSQRTPVTPIVTAPQPQVQQHKPLSMSVKQIDSIETMQQLYKNEPSYAQALNIAQHYYQTQRYSQAALWAKKANILERKRDGAWILYAKAEYAKGNQQRAIEILKLYLANARSDEGDALLRIWTQGE